jgi:hypothetical protein
LIGRLNASAKCWNRRVRFPLYHLNWVAVWFARPRSPREAGQGVTVVCELAGLCHDPSTAARKRRGPPVGMTIVGMARMVPGLVRRRRFAEGRETQDPGTQAVPGAPSPIRRSAFPGSPKNTVPSKLRASRSDRATRETQEPIPRGGIGYYNK